MTLFDWSGAANLSTLIRIAGFTINSSSKIAWFCSGGGCTGTVSSIRIDHNTYTTGSGGQFIAFSEQTSVNNYYFGVIDHNNITEAVSGVVIEFYGGLSSASVASASALGQSTNMFIENNNITVLSATNSGVGCTDGWGQAFSVVVRYNTAINCRWLTHGVDDGGGPRNFEFYNNSSTWNSGSSTRRYPNATATTITKVRARAWFLTIARPLVLSRRQ